MKKALLLDPFSGISGDMFLAALVDLGAPFDAVRDTLRAIPELSEVSVEKEAVTRGAIQATRINVSCPPERTHRSLADIERIIDGADLDPAVKRGAVRTFTTLARAEAKVHGVDIEQVHFHEVGALDAIVDIVGAHVTLHLLGTPSCLTTPLALGAGSTSSEHGEIPLPAPATVELLAGYPAAFSGRAGELVTPTGAAIVASTCEALDPHTVVTPERTGYGAGSREADGVPNVLRAILGTVEDRPRRVCIVTSTIDDMNPEMYGFVMERLFASGALEVYYNPIMMKKNRPGVEVTLISEEEDLPRLADVLFSTTTTLGVRIHREERLELVRRKETVETEFGAITVKVAVRPGGEQTVSPEYESCRKAAEKTGAGLMTVYEAARASWNQGGSGER
ncbi:MAG: nickel pincer cofactor biosynthesis protein LarC [Candidatus Krumholzibacteriia bacterium]